MIINTLQFESGGRCELSYKEADGWLQADWMGLIATHEALQGAKNYLEKAKPYACPFLLNNNQAMQGPWFDSVDWLRHAWLPQSEQMGLRYIAHVVQADTHTDIISLNLPIYLEGKLDLQVFDSLGEAQVWLRKCQVSMQSN
jgi:hypothetical protein